MKVGELVAFLGDYNDDCEVEMVTVAGDNPLSETLSVANAIAVKSIHDDTYIVLIPMS